MKLKYYLRGLGIGVMLTAIIMMIAYSGQNTELSETEIIKRAEALGMVMKEDPLFSNSEKDKQTETEEQAQTETETQNQQVTETEMESEIENLVETETESETQAEIETESETEPEMESESEQVSEPEGEIYHLSIPPGSVPRLICNELEEKGVIESSLALRDYLVEVGYATSIIVGEYDIPYGATNDQVYQILKAGPKK